MRGYLIRIAGDQAYGGWNAPVDPATDEFVYVPIPECRPMRPDLVTPYATMAADLSRFEASHPAARVNHVRLPTRLSAMNMHLDPDFRHLTYGDSGRRRGRPLTELQKGDVLLFYGGLKPTAPCAHRLIYALLGLYRVGSVIRAGSIVPTQLVEHAHTRCMDIEPGDVVVRAQPTVSGRFTRCIPIGGFRDGAYRVTPDILHAWGGLSCRDGYLQRSAVLPALLEPERALAWVDAQRRELTALNNS